MGGESGDLVPQSLGGDGGHILKDLFVDVEIEGEVQVVFFDQLSGGSLNGLGSDSSLDWVSGGKSFGILPCCFNKVSNL